MTRTILMSDTGLREEVRESAVLATKADISISHNAMLHALTNRRHGFDNHCSEHCIRDVAKNYQSAMELPERGTRPPLALFKGQCAHGSTIAIRCGPGMHRHRMSTAWREAPE